jgi:hypothetical protein
MRFIESDADVYHYTGQQYTWVGFDELTNWPRPFPYLFLHSCARSAHGAPIRIRASGNPGNPGHIWVKERFIDPHPKGCKAFLDKDTGLTRIFIPAKLQDNPALALSDPDYVKRLDNLPEQLRRPYKDGDWNVFVGQAFGEWRPSYHVIEPHEVPEAPRIMTFDWGFGRPFSVGWWYIDNNDKLIRFSEWYGWNGNSNEGVRLSDSEIAEGIAAKEKVLGIWGKPMMRIGDPGCFQKRPDYKGGGQGPSTATVFEQYDIFLKPGDCDRHLKKRAFHERLRIRGEEGPGLQVFSSCKHFIRTIPALTTNKNDPEDVDTDTEDHVYDEAALIVMNKAPGTRKRGLNADSMCA